jgi:hypothetical protein
MNAEIEQLDIGIEGEDDEGASDRTEDRYEQDGEETESNPDPGSPPSYDL